MEGKWSGGGGRVEGRWSGGGGRMEGEVEGEDQFAVWNQQNTNGELVVCNTYVL